MFLPVKEQLEVIKRGTEELISEEEMVRKLENSIKTNRPLRIKQGFDPTAPDIHLGHTVGIRKLRQFQDLGHKIVLIIGDYTGMVGDPSGKNETRPRLDRKTLMKNAETYENQFFKILEKSKTEIHYNGEWFAEMKFDEIMNLAAKFTIARILERDDFTKRYKEGNPISLHEFYYPLMQGYDSVAIKADVELGATEQKFNLLTARDVQREYGQEPQVILTLPVLEGIDGGQRMSKSLGNYIGIDDEPNEMYGKVMSIPDSLILKYFTLVTDYSLDQLQELKRRLDDQHTNPMVLKKELARTIIAMYHSNESARSAEQNFERVFSKKEIPVDIEEIVVASSDLPKLLVKALTDCGAVASNGEARRLIQQGGVRVNDEKINDVNYTFNQKGKYITKVGKRRFIKFIVK
ncbi:MAG: tyrosine--tRNA ligase [Candidatus Marinimicrobia bacterium]|jgi:tyrosyl-tRNA synthetase|nr:tyrosine--tRNA ligase [Candidatus Neomarinimicrobiota bacterium]MCK9559787.1 tyrosine--tRNA ligase [Candidatus Neomarinimicrobiota bacterium]